MPNYNASAFRNATPGLGALAQALMGGNQAFEQGREQAVTYQSKIANALAQQRAHDASADLAGAKAASERAGLEAQAPAALQRNAMLSNGIPLEEEGTVDAYLKTGKLGSRYDTPAYDGVGPTMPAPDWASKLSTVAAAIGGNRNAIAIGDQNSENVAKAQEINRTGRLRDDVIGGKLDPTLFAQAQFASSKQAPFHFSEYGVGNNLTGKVDDQNGPAQRFGALRTAETGKNTEQAGAARANAAQSYASADNSRASAAKTRTETGQLRDAPKGVLQQTDQGLLLVDPRTGTARPITEPDGKVAGKPGAGKEAPLNGEQANALTFSSRMKAANDILDQQASQGVKRPGTTKAISEGVAGAIPFFGDSAANAAGAATNWTQSAGQQQVEQAQRDFINAVLRRESGAAISMGEFDNAKKQYFPQVGDTPQVIAQKRAARLRVTDGMMEAVPESRRPKANVGGATGDWNDGAPASKNIIVDF